MRNQKSIAVLPLANLSSDPENEYFSDGMTEEIINALSKIDGLKVTARTSSFAFKGVKKDIRHIGNDLGVSLVLEGSVRKFNNQVRITTQLIRTDDGFHIWSESFDRMLEDIFSLQDEISLLVADRIRENYGHLELDEHLVTQKTDNIEAYDAYLKGNHFLKRWNLTDILKGANYYEESANLDPNFDLPIYGAGLAYSLLGSWGALDKHQAFKRAETFFKKGEKLANPQSTYPYHCLATHEFWGLWNYQSASNSIYKALKIDPNESNLNENLAEILTAIGDFSSALNSIDKSLQNNPLSPNHFYTKANIYYHLGQYDLAQKYLDESLKIDPDFALSVQLKLTCYIHQHNLEGLNLLVNAKKWLTYPEQYSMLYDLVHGAQIDEEAVRSLIAKLQALHPRPLTAYDLYLMVYISPEEGLEMLKQKVGEKMGQIVNFKHEKLLDPIRSHPDFKELVLKNFPDDRLDQLEVSESTPSKAMMTSEEVDYFSKQLLEIMEDATATYLNTDLSLKALAEKINLHPNKLSWLLNEKQGKNFNEFVNGYRLKSFQEKAIDPQYSHLTLLGLAYESGFSSKSVFNEFFRKSTNLTPKAWVKQHKR